jgi:hypothetical protein
MLATIKFVDIGAVGGIKEVDIAHGKETTTCLVADFSAASAASGGPASVAPGLGQVLAGRALVALVALDGAQAAAIRTVSAPSANTPSGV